MEYSFDDRINRVIEECEKLNVSKNPIEIFLKLVNMDFVRMHGPEHHILDGACILTAFHNAGGNIDLKAGLERIAVEGRKMPGAICGMWGVCGAVTSVGAALAFIDGTGPLTNDGTWGEHMKFTSRALERIGSTRGPRCCKRDGFISLMTAVEYINEHYEVKLECDTPACTFSRVNAQCIGTKCPFFSD